MNTVHAVVEHLAATGRPDRELLNVVAEDRDSAALSELYRRYAGTVRAVAADLCPNAADDVTQAAFVLLAGRAAELRDRASVAGWLFQVSRRLALKARTADARRCRREAKAPTPTASAEPLDELAFREVRALVAEELAGLPERLRVPLVLHYWEGVSHAVAAARLGCSVSTLKRWLDEGRARLGTRLSRRGVTGSSVLASLVTLHAQAIARVRPDPAACPAFDTVVGSDVANGAIFGASGVTKTVGLMCAAAVCVGMALALAAPPAQPPIAPEHAARTDPKAPKHAEVNQRLPAGALAKLGTDRFHHGGHIDGVVAAPDGRHAVSLDRATEPATAKLWGLPTGEALPLARGQLAQLPGGGGVVVEAAPHGRTIALLVAPRDQGKARREGPWLIDAVTGDILASIPRNGDTDGIAVHPAGRAAALTYRVPVPGGNENRYGVRLWKPDVAGEGADLLPAQPKAIHRLAFSPDGRQLAVQYAGGTEVVVLDAKTGKSVLKADDATDLASGPFNRFAFSPDGALIAKEDRTKKTIRVWALADGKERAPIPCEDALWGNSLVFAATGARLGLPTTRGTFRVYDLNAGKVVWEVSVNGRLFHSKVAAFTTDGKTIITGERDTLVFRDATTGGRLDDAGHADDIGWIAWTGDGKRVVTLDAEEGTVGRVWDAATGRPLDPIRGHKTAFAALATSPDGKLVATAGTRLSKKDAGDRSVRLWSGDGREVATLRPRLAADDVAVRHLWFSPDGRNLFGTASEAVLSWDVAKASESKSIPHPLGHVRHAYPLAGGERVLLAGWLPRRDGNPVNTTADPMVAVTVDLRTGKEIGARIEFGQHTLRGVSPDGRYALRGVWNSATEHVLTIWDLASGRAVWTVSGSGGRGVVPDVSVGVFSSDSRTLAVACPDGTARLIELATRSERFRFHHGAPVDALAYSPDGTRLATGGSRWGLVWDLRTSPAPLPKTDADAWAALSGAEAPAGYAAMRYWAARPVEAVRYFTEHQRPAAVADAKQVAALIDQLDSADFAEREAATKKLGGFGDTIRSQLAKATQTATLEASNRLGRLLAPLDDHSRLTGDRLRAVRAVEVLEMLRTPGALRLLRELAAGAPDARVTRDSTAALARLAARGE
jgi:RNA polymerase sigma factor (sigma-70 family)